MAAHEELAPGRWRGRDGVLCGSGLLRSPTAARPQHHEVPAARGVRAPYFGIAHVAGEVSWIVRIAEQKALLAERLAVGGIHHNSISLTPRVDVVVGAIPIGKLDIAGVKHAHVVVEHKCGARVHAMAIERLVGVQRAALVRPTHQVGARAMTPHLDAALDVKGGILEVRVKDAVLLVQTVGIVEPSHGWHQVIRLGPGARPARRGVLGSLHQLHQVALKCVGHEGPFSCDSSSGA